MLMGENGGGSIVSLFSQSCASQQPLEKAVQITKRTKHTKSR